jgi:hypothetical protein
LWKDKLVHQNFFSVEETKAKLQKICDEITSVTKDIANKNNIPVVLNIPSIYKYKKFSIPKTKDGEYNVENTNQNHLTMILDKNLEFDGGDKEIYNKAVESATNNYMGYYNAIFNIFHPMIDNRVITSNSTDLTAKILDKLWKNYGLTESKIRRLKRVITGWQRK